MHTRTRRNLQELRAFKVVLDKEQERRYVQYWNRRSEDPSYDILCESGPGNYSHSRPMDSETAKLMKERREALGLNQLQFAQLLSMSVHRLRRIEWGQAVVTAEEHEKLVK